VLTGSAGTCDTVCSHSPITACKSGDGCCASGCTNGNDSDCPPPAPRCGDGHVDPGETCDPQNTCPTAASCQSAGCKQATLLGDATLCTATCQMRQITAAVSGDGCCPDGATNVNDSDCGPPPTCGNGVLDSGEKCDDSSRSPCSADDQACNNSPRRNACWTYKLTGTGCQRECVQTGHLCGNQPNPDTGVGQPPFVSCTDGCDPWQ
jgi:hypothetical protein